MKKLITILLLFVCTSSFSQLNDTIYKLKPVDYKYKLAGIQLQKASKQYYAGVFIFVVGSAITTIGATNQAPNLIYIGGVLSLGGIMTMVTSHSHISKAGKYLIE